MYLACPIIFIFIAVSEGKLGFSNLTWIFFINYNTKLPEW